MKNFKFLFASVGVFAVCSFMMTSLVLAGGPPRGGGGPSASCPKICIPSNPEGYDPANVGKLCDPNTGRVFADRKGGGGVITTDYRCKKIMPTPQCRETYPRVGDNTDAVVVCVSDGGTITL